MAFDESGYLFPYEKQEFQLERVNKEFVESFAPQNEIRKGLWANLATYNNRLKILIETSWEQWIDGSFVTSKPEPGDIDVVNFIEYSERGNQRLGENISEMEFLFSTQKEEKSGSWNLLKIDGYLIPVYPTNHPLHKRFQMEVAYWAKSFGRDIKTNRRKGFVTVIHT